MGTNNEKDEITGVETTGHEWDGIKELNNPAPRWWLWVFFVCCLWAFGYWVIYPAWPTLSGNTKGIKGWTEYTKLKEEQAEIARIQQGFNEKIKANSLEDIKKDPDLYNFALAGGKAAFKENCAACHGTGAQGGNGYPNLNDDDWLWGGRLEHIYATIKYGIRSLHEQTRTSQMPAFGKDGILNREDILQVADYVLSLNADASQNSPHQSAKPMPGEKIFKENCAACHGETGKGNREMGAPNLTDAIWLYGSKKEDIVQQVNNPRHGVMPTWESRLPDATIKQLSIYVHSLGGGEQ